MALSTKASLPIGVFDSGIGGLTVLRELRSTFPQERFLYLGDTARTPYGSKGKETILRYSKECAHFLLNKGVKLLVIACNTASSLALGMLRAEITCPLVGTIEPAVKFSLRESKIGRIGVIGTEATIGSRAYEKRIHELNPDIDVISKACPLFVPLVEQGMVDGEIVSKVIELYLTPLKAEGIDTLILGCTHYPLLSRSINEFFNGAVSIVECSKAIAEETKEILLKDSLSTVSTEKAFHEFYATDDVQRFNRFAELILGANGLKSIHVEHLDLSH